MNISEANDVFTILKRHYTVTNDTAPRPDNATAHKAARSLADRAHKALHAGFTGDRVNGERAWPEPDAEEINAHQLIDGATS